MLLKTNIVASSKICSDGRKTAEKKTKRIKSNSEDPKDTFKYPKISQPGRYFWQMPFRKASNNSHLINMHKKYVLFGYLCTKSKWIFFPS